MIDVNKRILTSFQFDSQMYKRQWGIVVAKRWTGQNKHCKATPLKEVLLFSLTTSSYTSVCGRKFVLKEWMHSNSEPDSQVLIKMMLCKESVFWYPLSGNHELSHGDGIHVFDKIWCLLSSICDALLLNSSTFSTTSVTNILKHRNNFSFKKLGKKSVLVWFLC